MINKLIIFLYFCIIVYISIALDFYKILTIYKLGNAFLIRYQIGIY